MGATLGAVGTAFGDSGDVPAVSTRLTSDDAIREALAANLDLRAARHAIAQARARLVQVGLWANPSLELAGTHDFAFASDGEYAVSTRLEQRFPVAGRLERARDLARVDVAIAFAEVRDATRRLIAEVRTACNDLTLLEAQATVRDDLIAQGRRLFEVSGQRARLAEVSVVDVNAARLELDRLELERRTLAAQVQTRAAEVNRLLGRAPDAPLEVADQAPPPPPPPLAALSKAALARRPDLRQARLEADRAGAERALARAERWEDWAVGFGYDRDHQVVDGAPPQGAGQFLGLRLTMPLPLWNQNQGRTAEAEARTAGARDKVAALELAIRAELAAAHRRVEELGWITDRYHAAVVPLAERNVRLTLDGYRRALVNVTQVVQAQRQHGELRAGALDALAQYRRATIDLETAAATSPFLGGPPESP